MAEVAAKSPTEQQQPQQQQQPSHEYTEKYKLTQALNSVAQLLPLDLQRSYTLLKELDTVAHNLTNKAYDMIGDMRTRKTTVQERQALKKILDEICVIGEDRVTLTGQSYKQVDGEIQTLDHDLEKIENEMLQAPSNRGGRRGQRGGNNMSAGGDSALSIREQRMKKYTEYPKQANGNRNVELQFSDSMPVDPNEPRYCTCRQVSFGEMVACENEDCPTEWFHYECVGLETRPKGRWWCKQCEHLRYKSY